MPDEAVHLVLPHRRAARGAWERLAAARPAGAAPKGPAWPGVLDVLKDFTLQLQELRAECYTLLAGLDSRGVLTLPDFHSALKQLEEECAADGLDLGSLVTDDVGALPSSRPKKTASRGSDASSGMIVGRTGTQRVRWGEAQRLSGGPAAPDLHELLAPMLRPGAAVPEGAMGAVRDALRRGASPRGWAAPGSPMLAVVEAGHAELLELLLREKADPDEKDDKGVSVLHKASFRGDVQICRSLIESRADANARDRLGQPPIFFALDVATCEAIARGRADLEAMNRKGQCALHLAARAGLVDVLAWLSSRVDKKILVRRDAHGATPAYYARHAGVPHEALVRAKLSSKYCGSGSPGAGSPPASPTQGVVTTPATAFSLKLPKREPSRFDFAVADVDAKAAPRSPSPPSPAAASPPRRNWAARAAGPAAARRSARGRLEPPDGGDAQACDEAGGGGSPSPGPRKTSARSSSRGSPRMSARTPPRRSPSKRSASGEPSPKAGPASSRSSSKQRGGDRSPSSDPGGAPEPAASPADAAAGDAAAGDAAAGADQAGADPAVADEAAGDAAAPTASAEADGEPVEEAEAGAGGGSAAGEERGAEERAAVKIQAVHRGRATRSILQQQRAKAAGVAEDVAEDVAVSAPEAMAEDAADEAPAAEVEAKVDDGSA